MDPVAAAAVAKVKRGQSIRSQNTEVSLTDSKTVSKLIHRHSSKLKIRKSLSVLIMRFTLINTALKK